MKFCKDCMHHTPESSCDGGTLLPGFSMHFPAKCKLFGLSRTDVVTGKICELKETCKDVRSDEMKCGSSGRLFVPATLDGRLAMLEET